MGYLNFTVTIIAICLVYVIFIKPYQNKISKKVDLEDAKMQENLFVRPFIKLGRSIFCPAINGRVKGVYLFKGYYLSFADTKLTWLRSKRFALWGWRKKEMRIEAFVDNLFMAPYQGAFITVNVNLPPNWKHEYLDKPEDLAMMLIGAEKEFYDEYNLLEPMGLDNKYLYGNVFYGNAKMKSDKAEGLALKAFFPTKDIAIGLRAFIPSKGKSEIALEDCLKIFKSFSWEL